METKLGYQAKDISGLPLRLHASPGSDVTVDYMQEHQFRPGYDFVQEAARRGDNVGIDEFSDMASYTRVIRRSHCFVLQDTAEDTNTIVAMFLILPELSSSTMDQVVAEIRIFLSPDMLTAYPGIFSDLTRTAEKFVIDLDLGYVACVVNVAVPCVDWFHALRDEGYLIVATLPKNVNCVGQGLVGNCKLYKRLQQGTRPKRPDDVIMRTVHRVLRLPREQKFTQAPLPEFRFLPLQFRFKSGKEVNIRNRTHDDNVMLYKMFADAAESGNGFGSDEIPGSIYFNYLMLSYKICVLEEVDSKLPVGTIFLGESSHSRTPHPPVCETVTMLHPTFRRKGLGADMIAIGTALVREEGFKYVLNDSLITNIAVQNLVSSNAFCDIIPVGVLPLACHVAGRGYIDIRFEFSDVSNRQTIRQLCSERMSARPKSKI